MTPDREQLDTRLGAARAGLAACAVEPGITEVALALDIGGAISEVKPDSLAECVKAALGDAPFGSAQWAPAGW